MYEILGYPSEWSSYPGETIEFKVSCDGVDSYSVDIVKIQCGDSSPAGPGFKETLVQPLEKSIPGRKQTAYPGAYAWVEPFEEDFQGNHTWLLGIMPTLPAKGEWQTIFGRWDATRRQGYQLQISPQGCLVWTEGSGERVQTVELPVPLIARKWYQVSITVDRTQGQVRLLQKPMNALWAANTAGEATSSLNEPIASYEQTAPLVMGAYTITKGLQTQVMAPYNGRIDSLTRLPYIATKDVLEQLCLPPQKRHYECAPDMEWDFSQGMQGDELVDLAAPGRKGLLRNLPTRGVPGMRWDSSAIDWKQQPDHYAALHFHDDNLEDAQWETDFYFQIPLDLRSGMYAARCQSGEHVERITFFVLPQKGARTRKIAFLASTATYLAYSNSHYRLDEPGMEMKSGNFAVIQPWEQYLGEHRELGLSTYDTHSDGYGVYYASRRRPVFSMHVGGRPWALNGDTHMLDWLETRGFDFDVITDDMLHCEGLAALEPYQVIVTGAHPEYWTTPMWDAMVTYQNSGGRLMYMGGNGFYWRCAYHADKPWLMEVRRAETGARYSETPAGESFHSFTGEYAGTWRRIGKAPQTLVGIGTAATGFDASSYYRRRPESNNPRAQFIFEGVDEEIIGNFGSIGGGAAGDEIDRADFDLGTPAHALVIARSENHTRYYNLAPEEIMYAHPTINGQEAQYCYADMVYYECLQGGAVFSTGSITWSASLAHNNYSNNVAQITENVLMRFADPTPIAFPTHRMLAS
jgi:N,N-dimethylformamidase